MDIKSFEEKKDEFLIYLDVEKNLSENTYRSYKNDLEQFIHFWKNICETTEILEIPLRQILERYLVSMYHKKIDKSSIARKVSCFRSFEKYVSKYGIKLNLNLLRPKIDKKLPVYLTIDEISQILDNTNIDLLPTKKPYRDKAIFELLYATGIRCSELVNIKLSDIDFENKLIRVMGKGRKERIVLFGQKAKENIITYLEKERCEAQNLQEKIFLNNRKDALTSRSVQRIIEMFRKFLKIERKITPHKLRHSFATHMLNNGVDLRVVQELLGHKSISSTEKYTHLSTAELTKICETIHPINNMIKKANK